MRSLWAAMLFIAALAGPAAGQSADLLIVNANVRTMDPGRPNARAIAIKGDRILRVGSEREVRALASAATRIIDARGMLVMPGFNDAHVHFTALGNKFSHLELKDAADADAVISRVASFATFIPAGRWIIGAGLTPAAARQVSLARLDSVSQGNPVYLYLTETTQALVNSAAMDAARLPSAERPAPGLVTGSLAVRIRNAVPRTRATDWAAMAEIASRYAASLGVTSIQDVHSDDLFDILSGLSASGRLDTRVYDCTGLNDWEKAGKPRSRPQGTDPMVRRGCLKWLTNGTVEESEELTRKVRDASGAGYQILIHAIGPSSNRIAIDSILGGIPERDIPARRPRLEHAHGISRADGARAAKAGIVLSMQPALFYAGPDGSNDDLNWLLSAGVNVALGSDASMIDIDPLDGIYAAVNAGKNSISVEQAVYAYTAGAARAEFQVGEKGTLSPGKFADIVMLDRDIFTIDRRRIRDAAVKMTITGGRVVYEANDAVRPELGFR